MARDFWLERWRHNQIGFHQPQGQPLLAKHWPALGLALNAPVLVPLCGKTPDMAWLAARGHAVTGVEFSDLAARDFFAEQGLRATRDTSDGFVRYRSEHIEICIGDFLALPQPQIAGFAGVYDRAALIALPREQRRAYAEHLLAGLGAGAVILLITLDYDPRQMQGPPFAVDEAQVQALYGHDCRITKLEQRDALTPGDHLSSKGLSAATERVYRIERTWESAP